MVTWPSLNAFPPSLLYPAENSKWWARTGLPGTLTATAPNGKPVAIIELRGWLTDVAGACSIADPDWHYQIELDVEWLDSLGLPVEQLLLPGDTLDNTDPEVQGEIQARSSVRCAYGRPLLHIELDAWQRLDNHRGQPPKPASWTFTNDCNNGAAVWPFNPRNPKPGDPPLAVGQYVRVVGSLVSDEPHMMRDWLLTDLVLRFGNGAVGNDQAGMDARANAVKWLWGPNRPETDPAHPARWNEIHSPDTIEVLAPKARSENVRCLALVAQNGLGNGDVESLQAQVPAPPRPTRWHTLSMRKRIGPATIASTVQVDEFTPLGAAARLRAQVQGQSGLGASGKFYGIYRVGWRGIAPALHAVVSANGSLALAGTDADGNLVARTANAAAPLPAGAWAGVQQGRGLPGGHVTGVSRAPGLFDLFIAGNDRRVYTAAQAGGPWAGWWQIPGVSAPVGAPVYAASRGPNKLDIFVADDSGRTMSAAWEPGFNAWHGWWHLQGGLTAPGGHVTVASRRADFLDIFCVGTDGRAWTAGWQPGPSGWVGWVPIGNNRFPVGAPLTAVSRSTDRLDLFGADQQGRVMAACWQPGFGNWQVFAQVQNGTTTPGATVAVASRGIDQLDLCVIGLDGQVCTCSWDRKKSRWLSWRVLPGLKARPGTPLEAFCPTPGNLVVLTTSESGHLMFNRLAPGLDWSGWALLD